MSRARDLADGTFSGAVVAASADFTGTVEAADLSDGTTTVGTEYVTNGSAKAWVNFNGTGTIAAGDSFNLASLTDLGTGQYAVNFASGFANTAYAGGGSFNWSTSGNQIYIVPSIATTCLCYTLEANNYIDRNNVQCITHGDLA
jgi:hypothetical protein